MSKTILITGASRGFGKIWAEAFLKRGDKVAVTARNPDTLKSMIAEYGDSVLALQLDVNNRDECFDVVQRVQSHFGRIDVLINNAGYGLFGAIEETTEQQAREQMETNFFGLLWVTQAVLPVMRAQKNGHIVQVSSFLGLATLPVLGIYNASKFAVEGMSETLATEVASFGIKVSMIEPNGFTTEWGSASATHTQPMAEYEPLKKTFHETATPEMFGDPQATIDAVFKLVDSAIPPLRLLLGKVAYPFVKQVYEERLASWGEWKEVSDTAHGV
ncbi:MAG: short-chain dehydrogenase/reductase [Marivirga sp.]|nr:short-chain dehydrogenase/reductase [Marivirga sp.]